MSNPQPNGNGKGWIPQRLGEALLIGALSGGGATYGVSQVAQFERQALKEQVARVAKLQDLMREQLARMNVQLAVLERDRDAGRRP